MDEQLEYRLAVSKDYDMMQGLLPAATGLGLLVTALTGNGVFSALSLCLAGAGEGWYRKRYGQLRASNERNVAAAVGAAIALVAIMIATGMDFYQPGPILYTPLVSALALGVGLRLGLRHVGLTGWHWATLVVMAVCSFLPLVGWHPNRWATLAPLAIGLIVIGLVDHTRLVKAFGKGTAGE